MLGGKHSPIIINTSAFILGFSNSVRGFGPICDGDWSVLILNRPILVRLSGILVMILGLFLLGFLIFRFY